MQTQTGIVSCLNLQNRVIGGTDVNWEQIEPGDWFSFIGDAEVPISIQAVYEPGHLGNTTTDRWELTLVVNNVGGDRTDVNYTIHSDFSPNLNFPLLSPGDVQTAQILTRAFQILDAIQAINPSQSGKNHDEGIEPITTGTTVYTIPFNYTITPAPTSWNLQFFNGVDGDDAIDFPYIVESITTTGMQVRLLATPTNDNSQMYWSVDGSKALQETLAYAATMQLDFGKAPQQIVTLTGAVNFASSANEKAGQNIRIHLLRPAANRAITWNANFRKMNPIITTQLAGKHMVIEASCLASSGGGGVNVEVKMFMEP